ncbi:hypothetical protein BGZ93_008913 [Podila epicladia]|nr:hypothetical protein BGZ93_008913 [Podila epicladia]
MSRLSRELSTLALGRHIASGHSQRQYFLKGVSFRQVKTTFERFTINTAILLACGKYLERAWGSREFFKFLAITSIGTMIGVYLTSFFEYLVRRNEDILTPVKHISNAFFGILVKLKICSPTGFGGSFHYDLENPQMSGMGHTFTQPGSLRAEAERRRQLALKALDMRLHAAMGNSGSGLAGSGRQTFLGSASTKATSVSLLSLSAEPLPVDDEDEVLFETDALNVNGPSGQSRTASTSDHKEARDKE